MCVPDLSETEQLINTFKTADMIDDSGVRSTRKGEISNVTNKQIDLNRERRGTDGMTKPSVNVNVRLNILVCRWGESQMNETLSKGI